MLLSSTTRALGGLVRQGESLHKPGPGTRQGSHFKLMNACSNCKTSNSWQNIWENHIYVCVCKSLSKFPTQPDSSKMCSWPPCSQNCSRWGLWCRFSGRFSMGIKSEISRAPKLHHETLSWWVRQEHSTRRTRFHVRVRIPCWGIHDLIVEFWKYNKTIEKIEVVFCLQLLQGLVR